MKCKPVLIMALLLTFEVATFGIADSALESADRGPEATAESILKREYELAGKRTAETHYYAMETKIVQFSPDGKRIGVETYRLKLACVPANQSGKDSDQYTCRKFILQKGDAPPTTIPALNGWSYQFKRTESGLDESGQVFGIDHAKFENLVDSNNNPLSPDVAYAVYNTFIDFHAFCNVFAERTHQGQGIQNLKSIGQKIVHDSAFSEPPISLGSTIAKGSTFKNGEVTLFFKGLSIVDDVSCALVAFDSGESSFKMVMQPMPNMKIKVVGGSHYKGDIYIDLASNWVRKVTMGELVVTEVILPMPPNKINSVIERNSLIQMVSKEEFLQN